MTHRPTVRLTNKRRTDCVANRVIRSTSLLATTTIIRSLIGPSTHITTLLHPGTDAGEQQEEEYDKLPTTDSRKSYSGSINVRVGTRFRSGSRWRQRVHPAIVDKDDGNRGAGDGTRSVVGDGNEAFLAEVSTTPLALYASAGHHAYYPRKTKGRHGLSTTTSSVPYTKSHFEPTFRRQEFHHLCSLKKSRKTL